MVTKPALVFLGKIKQPFGKFLKIFAVLLILVPVFWRLSGPVSAQTVPTPTVGASPGEAYWTFDEEVTTVGKASERARQFIWWVFDKPAIHYHPVLVELWSISRNIMYVFVVFIVAIIGLGIIISRRSNALGQVFSGIGSPFSGSNYFNIFVKIAKILFICGCFGADSAFGHNHAIFHPVCWRQRSF